MDNWTRRRFLTFMGAGSAAPFIQACSKESGPFKPLGPTLKDDLVLVPGLQARLLIAYGDPINKNGDTFGYDNDYIACVTDTSEDDIFLWVNHESVKPFLMHGLPPLETRKEPYIQKEREAVGGSILKLKRKHGQFELDIDDPHNRRVHADTPIPFKGGGPLMGATEGKGTLANCAGGVTPWDTFLTCEENYYKFYGEVSFPNGQRKYDDVARYYWEKNDPRPPEHYGWVVEVDPRTGESAKLLGLGRMAHECATCVGSKDERTVVYTGDDLADECLYKFIADKPGSLEHGKLYVAHLPSGSWLLLDHEQNPKLKGHFKDRTDMLVRTREAARLAGGTPLARPEDIEIHPATGDVFVCLTNDDQKKNYHGSILRIREEGGNHHALKFSHDTFLAGGEENGFSSPDNLVFDRKGNLWFTCDVSESKINKGVYKPFGNNGLFYVPMSGPAAGRPMRVASAPIDAELTGPCFSPDGRQLFLSVQHPGSASKPGKMTSQWPDGAGSKPRPGVVIIDGPLMDALVG